MKANGKWEVVRGWFDDTAQDRPTYFGRAYYTVQRDGEMYDDPTGTLPTYSKREAQAIARKLNGEAE